MVLKNEIFVVTDSKLADVILTNPSLMLVLEHFDIKLELHEKTVSQICLENNISTHLFLTVVNLFSGYKSKENTRFSVADIQMIITYLKNCHSYYQLEKYPQIRSYIDEIYTINKHENVKLLDRFFKIYFNEVNEHLDYENQVVFPYVLYLNNVIVKKQHDSIQINYSVTEYKEHHNDIEEKLTDLKNLLIKYLPLDNDQLVRRKLLFCLFELEKDLKIHSEIEDTILIPLVEKMEQMIDINQ